MKYDVAERGLSFMCCIAVAMCFPVGLDALASSPAPLNTLTFDEIPFQPVDDLAFAGVTFDFKVSGVDSSDAFYNSFGPGALDNVQDPSLTGDSAGVLTLTFDVPTSVLKFGVALNTATALMSGFEVELFDRAMNSLGTTAVDVLPVTGNLGFSENQFLYDGTPITRAVIDFADEPGSFAIDNLTYAIIPEPSAMLIGLLSIATLAAARFPAGAASPSR